MTARKLHLRVRRSLQKSKKQITVIGSQAGENVDRNLVRRLSRLTSVRRFIVSWILLIILLIGGVLVQTQGLSNYYQTLRPIPGGVYNEGILGSFTNANPVYATGSVDSAVARLVFSGLFTYNDTNQLVSDLATGWSVNGEGNQYTVYLRPNLTWQDGLPLTSADVLFTYQVIQNPDAQSPLQASFEGITVTAPNPETVVFSLPNPLSSFPDSLTNGIIPKHILGNIPMEEMRSVTFNTLDPVGSGPFIFSAVDVGGNTPKTRQESIELLPFSHYWAGKPKLSEFVIRAFNDQDNLISSFEKNDLTAVAGLSEPPPGISNDNKYQSYSFPLTAATMVFFRTTSGALSDVNVRQALVEATNQLSILSGLGYPAIAVKEPLLEGQLAYNPLYNQAVYNPTLAAQKLSADGWLPGPGGVRYKNGQPLTFTLTSSNSSEYSYVAHSLQQEWKDVGVNMQLSLQDDTDLQNSVSFHSYDAILYGISIGVDPDVFVYWDSSQADPRSPSRLNLSEYKSAAADDSLEEGRTRSDPALRVIKYEPFLQAWQQDAPAVGLYQPRFYYLTNGPVFGLSEHTLNNGTDRYDNVQNWEIREAKVTD